MESLIVLQSFLEYDELLLCLPAILDIFSHTLYILQQYYVSTLLYMDYYFIVYSGNATPHMIMSG